MITEEAMEKEHARWEQVRAAVAATRRALWSTGLLGKAPAVMDVPLSRVRFSQCSVYPVLTGIGASIDEFTEILRNGGWDSTADLPRAVLWPNGYIQCFDHRRIICAKLAGLKTLPFQLFRPDDPLPDDPMTKGPLKVDVSEEECRAAAALVGDVHPFGPGTSLQKDAKANTWGDAVVYRSAMQTMFGDKDFPLIGRRELPSVQWDLLVEYQAHCKRLLELPAGSPIIYFKPKRPSMFLERSTLALAGWLRKHLALSGTLEPEAAAAGGALRARFHDDWQEVSSWLVQWCNDVLAISPDGTESNFKGVSGGIVARLPAVEGAKPGDAISFSILGLAELSAHQVAQAALVPSVIPPQSGGALRCVAVRVRLGPAEGDAEYPGKSTLAVVAWCYNDDQGE